VANNNTLDGSVLMQRAQAIKIIYYGFDDDGLAAIITDGQADGWVDNVAYSTGTPQLGI